MSLKARLLMNLFAYLGFCVIFVSFRSVSALVAYSFGVFLIEYLGYRLTDKK